MNVLTKFNLYSCNYLKIVFFKHKIRNQCCGHSDIGVLPGKYLIVGTQPILEPNGNRICNYVINRRRDWSIRPKSSLIVSNCVFFLKELKLPKFP